MDEIEINLEDDNIEVNIEEGAVRIVEKDYNKLNNKPQINNVELKGNKLLADLGIQPSEQGKGLSTNDFSNEYKGQVDNNTLARHLHDNKSVLDGISSTDVSNWNNKAETSDIPTDLAELSDDSTHRVVTDTEKQTWNNKSDFSGSYNDLSNKPNIPSKTSDLTNDSGFIDKTVNNLTNYTLKTNTGSLIDLEIDSTDYVVTLRLKNQDGTVISTDTIDLPLESVVVSGRYDNNTKKVILTLENGSEVDFSVADLVAGLQTELSSSNKLNADYVDDTNSGNKFTNTSEKSAWNAKYDKQSGGIPSTDLSSAVQTSLGKADTAVQDVSGKEDKSNKVTSLSSSSTDTQYPSAKCVYDLVGDIGTTLDTIQGEVI